jgi:RNA polymerase sigma-70 factor (sigma-E family)
MGVMARNSQVGSTEGPDLAFEGLVRARLPALLRLGMLLSSNASDAEDLVQATLTKAFAARESVTAADDPAAYLTTIMVNTFRSWRRRLVLERALPAPDPTGLVDRHAIVDDRRDLVRALADLPARQRLAVVLRYCLDLSEADAARVLGCATGTVRSHASRGIAKLRLHPALAPLEPKPRPKACHDA